MRKRDKVLLAVANWKRAPADWRDRSGPTHHDIAVACGRTYSTADWAHAAIRQLLEAGHITVVAKTQFGREYAVTEAGRAALAEKSTQGRYGGLEELADMGADAATLKFGDRMENLWASPDNPSRFAYFVRYGYRKGLINGGKFIEVTDGKGSFWTFADDAKRAENVRKVADSPIAD